MSAILSPDLAHRFRLERPCNPDGQHVVVFVGVNPSTADADLDDATVRKWRGFATRWGYKRFVAVNLFSLRSTDVKMLATYTAPCHPDNLNHLARAFNDADTIVPCWGDRTKIPKILWPQIDLVRGMMAASGAPVWHLGLTKGGDPKHPLMLGYSTPLIEWNP